MERREVEAILEACLATAGAPVPSAVLAEVLDDAEWDAAAVEAVLRDLSERWREEGRGLRIERVAGAWRMITDPVLDPYLRALHGSAAAHRLSPAALEVLAIVAYRQPVTLPEINFLRGVNSGAALRTLLDRGLVRVAGRKRVVGKPFLYRTTRRFLEHFGLDRIEDLPKPEELTGAPEEGGVGEGSDGLDDTDPPSVPVADSHLKSR